MHYKKKHLSASVAFAPATHRGGTLDAPWAGGGGGGSTQRVCASGPVDGPQQNSDQAEWECQVCQSAAKHWPSILGDVFAIGKEGRKQGRKEVG